eukprot:5043483-Alexandrium_andersonii.AAC.1
MFGPEAVVCAAPYLGCTVSSSAGTGPACRCGHWSADACCAFRAGTWDAPCGKVVARAQAI